MSTETIEADAVYVVVMKLVGRINPVGKTETDNERFENLKKLCTIVDNLVAKIDEIAYKYKDAHEHSVKRSAEYAHNFIINTIGIK